MALAAALLSCSVQPGNISASPLGAATIALSPAPSSTSGAAASVAPAASSDVRPSASSSALGQSATPAATSAAPVVAPPLATATTASSAVPSPRSSPSLNVTPRPTPLRRASPPVVGATAYDWFAQAAWNNPTAPWAKVDPVEQLAANGVEWLRAGVTTVDAPALETIDKGVPPWKDEFWNSREYTLHVLEAGARAGMRLSLFFFLTDRAAGAANQPAPAAWANYSIDQTAAALEEHTRDVATFYRAHGLHVDQYEIGNEIDFGVAGFSADTRISARGIDIVHDTAWDRQNIWQTEATLLKGAIRGVKAVDPSARILLHLASPEWPWLMRAFLSAMVDLGVPFDAVGYSYYPWSNHHPEIASPSDALQQSVSAAITLGKRVVISEFDYPSGVPTGVPANPLAGYPFTPTGQADWVRDLLVRLRQLGVEQADYYYPDNFLVTGIGVAALFNSDGTPKPAMVELGRS